jgi:hypothetical protein
MREIDVLGPLFKSIAEVAPTAAISFVNQLGTDAANYWRDLAEGASDWGERYASTITFVPARNVDGEVRVFADEIHPNFKFVQFMEGGIKSWSIKDALLRGKVAQRNLTKYGVLFVTVPFAHRTPRASKSEKAGSSFASIMPEQIYNIAKSGGRVDESTATSAGNKNWAGLQKYGEGAHGHYMTFRTVSEKSTGWQYPEVPATPVFEQVQAMLDRHIAESMDSFVKAMIKLVQEDMA